MPGSLEEEKITLHPGAEVETTLSAENLMDRSKYRRAVAAI